MRKKGKTVQIAATLIHFIIGKVDIFGDFNQFEQIIICIKLNITFSLCEEKLRKIIKSIKKWMVMKIP